MKNLIIAAVTVFALGMTGVLNLQAGDTAQPVWQPTKLNPTLDVRWILPMPNGDLWVSTRRSGVLHSTDHGESWTAVNNGLPSPDKLLPTHIAADAQNYVYLGTKQGLYRTAKPVPLLSKPAILCVGATVNPGVGTEQSAAALPPGVKAVWDMSKAHRETTPTRERTCINGLWRWQPAEAKSEQVPAGNWGYFKVPGCWPGITDYSIFYRRVRRGRRDFQFRLLSAVSAFSAVASLCRKTARRSTLIRAGGARSSATSQRPGTSGRSRSPPIGPAAAFQSASSI